MDGENENTTIPFTKAPGTSPTEEAVEVDIKVLSCDLVDAAGKIWHTVNPRVPEFEQSEIKKIATPLAAVIEKHGLTKYIKYMSYTQEILLVYNTFNVVAPRIKELKKPVSVISNEGETD